MISFFEFFGVNAEANGKDFSGLRIGLQSRRHTRPFANTVITVNQAVTVTVAS